MELIISASSVIPPGLSLTVTTNRAKRPSAARPLSKTRPSTVVSMLPPHSGMATLLDDKEKIILGVMAEGLQASNSSSGR